MADYTSEFTGPQIDALLGKVNDADNTPTTNSVKMVTSGGVKAAMDAKQDTIDDLSTIRSQAAESLYVVENNDPTSLINN